MLFKLELMSVHQLGETYCRLCSAIRRIILVLLVLLPLCTFAQQNHENVPKTSLLEPVSETLEELSIFKNDDPLKITLKYDITSFIRHKEKGEYLDAVFIMHLNPTDSIRKKIRLKARGKFRRGHCFFPPIYLNFKTDPLENTELAGIKKIKLVTHCSSSKLYRKYILKEYLAYRLYNILSENSFRVKLVNIEYIDTGKKQRNYQRLGFLIEPLELIAKRTNSVEVQPERIRGPDVVEEESDVVSLFQYLIANTDWRIKGGHNMKYLRSLSNTSQDVTPIPYDFDYSGFVGTSYAVPQTWTSIENVKEREYLGYCRNDDADYQVAIDHFIKNKDEIMHTLKSFEYLDEKERKYLMKFTEDFYKMTERPKVLINTLKRECRTDF